MNPSDRSAYLMLIGMAICFGGTWVPAAVAVDSIPPFTIAALRFGLASLLLFAWARLARQRLSPVTLGDLPVVAGLALTAVAGYNWLFLQGLTMAPASDGAIIVPGVAPILTTVIASLTLGERLAPRALVGLAVAAIGLVLVVQPEGGTNGTRLIGDALFLGGALLWAVYTVLARRLGRRFNAISTTLYGIALGTVLLVPLALLEGGVASVMAAPVEALAGVAYLAVFGTVAAFVLLNLGMARIGASRASAFALLVPIVGVLSSIVFLGERLGPTTVVGGAVVLAGLWLVEHATTARRAAAGPAPATTGDV